ncbi:hypothetical protein AUEXF2481DRAFT_135324 [Aureobasidium subglaciale EXF-2481]|uniref:Uncharacterized protein n=1 Tax=Aureobasidium subglaciale (strain EXF-2481) TaxID=1043005 RepID=A0A074YRX9_AURSE|nr:uncharacterized protein AUEXF2481DRAFT_135324 [Aureobasidium subglaciale EXF-2481]KER00436.1 hypothetical protein AUEXF2481DRAFT_135324 [Aureobasidium subglaciale EXF-2481]
MMSGCVASSNASLVQIVSCDIPSSARSDQLKSSPHPRQQSFCWRQCLCPPVTAYCRDAVLRISSYQRHSGHERDSSIADARS